MKTLLSLLLATLLFTAAPPAHAQQDTTGWVQHHDYQYFYDEGFYGNLVPTSVEATMINGQVHYRSTFGYRPQGVNLWATHHGMTDTAFAQRNQQYLNQGYRLVSYHRLYTGAGHVNQGIWYR